MRTGAKAILLLLLVWATAMLFVSRRRQAARPDPATPPPADDATVVTSQIEAIVTGLEARLDRLVGLGGGGDGAGDMGGGGGGAVDSADGRCEAHGCAPGDPDDGGVALLDGICPSFCSTNGYCGDTAAYMQPGSVDCAPYGVAAQDRPVFAAVREAIRPIVSKIDRLKMVVDDLSAEVTGQRHLDALHDAYIHSALRTQAERDMRHRQLPVATEPSCELLVLISTGYRQSLANFGESGFGYLNSTLRSLRTLAAVPGGLDTICVLVVNMSPGQHPDFAQLQRENLARNRGAGDPSEEQATHPCSTCIPGDLQHGGSFLDAAGFCPTWCSHHGLCGSTSHYKGTGAINCRAWLQHRAARAVGDISVARDASRFCKPHGCVKVVGPAAAPPAGNATDAATRRMASASAAAAAAAGGAVELTKGHRCTGYCWQGSCGRSIEHVAKGANCTGVRNVDASFRFVEQINFDDPYPQELKKNVGNAVASNRQTRIQGIHLSHGLLEAARWPAKYILIMEDDMPACNATGLQHIGHAISLADETSSKAGIDWSMIRVGFGGNGVIIHWNDAVGLGSYLLKHSHRRPVDWLMPEWASASTFAARMVNSRRYIFTYRANLFEHIGGRSTFDDRVWTKNASWNLPKCYDLNTFMRPEEGFMAASCPGMISPCWCTDNRNFCFQNADFDAPAGGTNTWGDTDDLDELEAQRTSKSKLKKMLVGAMARLKKSRKGERERGGTG